MRNAAPFALAAILFGVPLAIAGRQPFLSLAPQLQAAIVGVFGTLVTAVVTVLLFTKQQDVRQAEREAETQRRHVEEATRRERAEAEARSEAARRRRRLASGLRAEVAESLTRLLQQFTPELVVAALRRDARNFDQAAKDGTRGLPAGVGPERNTIFERHQDELSDLPEPVIWAIVSYYQNDLHLAQYLNRMTEGAFDGLSVERQRGAAVQYRDLGQDTLRSALRAKGMLDAFLIQSREPSDDAESADITALAEELMKRRPADPELAEILRSRQSRQELGQVLLDLPSDDSTEHLAEFRRAVGLSEA